MGMNDVGKMVNLKGGNIKPYLVSPKSMNNIYEVKSLKEIGNTETKNYNSNVIQGNTMKNKKDRFYKK